ncbi:MAG: MarC family protein [Leptospiraceae bacterium]|nr:MarC family protein [Leptospiraceae bacterium]MDW8306311.1 MarC family protein [Leptospiraceae bacterium]
MVQEFFLSFVPLFVAVDPFGVLPLYLSVAQNYEPKKRQKILTLSITTAFLVAFLFLAFGHMAMAFLRISLADFQIAGGIILFALALIDLVIATKTRHSAGLDNLGVVPLGVPILVGPAVFTTLILLRHNYGLEAPLLALVAVMSLTYLIFSFASSVARFLGESGVKIISKIAMLFLASIGVMMVRRGVSELLRTWG